MQYVTSKLSNLHKLHSSVLGQEQNTNEFECIERTGQAWKDVGDLKIVISFIWVFRWGHTNKLGCIKFMLFICVNYLMKI